MYGISNSQQQGGGGGSAASYKAIKSTLTRSDWQEVGEQPYFVGENAMTWEVNENTEMPTKSQPTNIGLVAGNSYTITVVADNVTYTSTGEASGGPNGAAMIGFEMSNMYVYVYDKFDVSTMSPTAEGSFCCVETAATNFVITNFEGGGFGTTMQATISDGAIKVNSAVTMYINTSEKIAVVEKTNGSVTLTAPSIPTSDIPYSLEIVGTDTEGLFDIVNAYVPTVTSELSNDSGFLTKDNFVAGDNVTITNENDNLIISATGGGGGGGSASQWNTIYEDTTGSGAVSVELSKPLQAGGLYRITLGGSVYMFCSPDSGRVSYTGNFTISAEVFQNATTMGHLAYYFTHNNTSLSLKYLAQYTITADGASNISFADNTSIQAMKITKVEVYR